jgi:hypothetical protein
VSRRSARYRVLVATSGAQLATAIGTIAAAAAAAGGLGVALIINAKDRQAASDLAEADRAAARDDERRRYIVSLLLKLGEQLGIQQAYAGAPQAAESGQQIRLLLHALPEDCAYTVRHANSFTAGPPEVVGEKLKRMGLTIPPGATGYSLDQNYVDIADDLDRYTQA